MSETTVSFLTEVMSGGAATYPVSVRVFSTEIAQSSATIYSDAIDTLQHAIGWDPTTNTFTTPTYWDSSSQTWVADPSKDPSQTIQSVMQFLDAWSQMKVVSGGQEGYSSGTVDGLSVSYDAS